MDSSDLIRKLKEKTVFYNLQAQFSTINKGCVPTSCDVSTIAIKCTYNFDSYEIRNDYTQGSYQYCSSCTCSSC